MSMLMGTTISGQGCTLSCSCILTSCGGTACSGQSDCHSSETSLLK